MPAEVSCSACGAALQIPEGLRAPWVECPRCRAMVVNPHALQLGGGVRLTWGGAFGTVLMLLSSFGWVGGGVAILVDHLFGHGREERWGGNLLIHTVCCAFLFASGASLVSATSSKARRPLLFIAAGLGILFALTFLAVSGLIVFYVTCFKGG